MIFLALLACSEPAHQPQTPADAHASHDEKPAADAHSHGAGGHGEGGHGEGGHGEGAEHGHGAKHGGIQKELEGMHLEGLAMPNGLMLWVTDGDANPLSLDGFSGSAVVKGPAGVSTVELRPMGDHLHAPATLEQGKPATIVVTLTREGKAQSVTFDVAAVGMSSHDHTSLHGGPVAMWGNTHVEWVGKDGEHRFYVSDANRVAISEGLSTGTVKDGEASIPLAFDPAVGALTAKAEGAGSRPVNVEFGYQGQTISLPFSP